MTNPLVPFTQAQLPAAIRAKIAGRKRLNDDLSAGITGGFPVLSFRGKAWHTKWQGAERTMLNEDGTPRYAIEVVLLKVAPHISKVWYEAGYIEGSTAAPDCWSVDAIKPDPASPKLQNSVCKTCRWNMWGSSRAQGGSGKGKDCADSKRVAIAPLMDIPNEAGGGPLLLRVPPASLQELLAYAGRLEQVGYPYYAVATQLSFDVQAQYPKLTFKAIRALTDAEADQVLALQDSDVMERILNMPVDEVVHTDGADTTHVQVGEKQPVPAPQQRPVQTAQSAPTPTPVQAAPAPVEAPATLGGNIPPGVPPSATPAPVTGEAMEERRKQLRAMGISEATVIQLCGPEPKPEPAPAPEDPRIAQLRAVGLTDEQIKVALAATGVPMGQLAANGHGAEAPRGRGRPRGPSKPKEASPAATTPAPAPTPVQSAPAPVQAAPELPQQGGGDAFNASFDAMLDGIIAQQAQGNE
jgi:hypothetical protein